MKSKLAIADMRPRIRRWQGEQYPCIEYKMDGRYTTLHRSAGGQISAFGKKVWRNLWSRLQGNQQIRKICQEMPRGCAVDGELICADGSPATSVPQYLIKCPDKLEFVAFAVPVLKEDVLGDCFADPGYYDSFLQELGFKTPERLDHSAGVITKDTLQEAAMDLQVEGFILKQYHYDGWVKYKSVDTVDCVVMGWLEGDGRNRNRLGSLIVGVYLHDSLIEISRVGKGFSDLQREAFTAANTVGRVCEVAYERQSTHGKLQFSRFIRWRDDKPAEQCTIGQIT